MDFREKDEIAIECLKKYYPSLVRQEDEFGLSAILEAMEEYAERVNSLESEK